MSSRVDEKIAGLESLDAAARRAHPEQAFGRPPPKGSNQRLLRYAAAYDAHPPPGSDGTPSGASGGGWPRIGRGPKRGTGP